MMTDAPFTTDEIRELRKLLEVEKIRKVKNLYSQLMDARDWDALEMIYAEDVVADLGPYGSLQGRKTVTDAVAGRAPDSEDALPSLMRGRAPYDGLHNTTNMWIELTGPSTAISRTYLHDVLFEDHPRINPVFMFGVYEEDYAKIEGEWKITRFCVQFLWPQRIVSADFPRPMTVSSLG